MAETQHEENSSILYTLVAGVFLLLGILSRLAPISCAWTALFLLSVAGAFPPEVPAIPILAACAFVLTVLALLGKRWAGFGLPVYGDVLVRRRRQHRAWAKNLPVAFGFMSPTDSGRIRSTFKNGVWTFRVRGAHMHDPHYVEAQVEKHLSLIPKAVDFSAERLSPDGDWRIEFYGERQPDPLMSPHQLHELAETDVSKSEVCVGVTEHRTMARISLKDVSGVVVGGLPGGGKTAGMTVWLAPLMASAQHKITVFDGKGGMDWERYSPFVDWSNDDEDFASLRDALKDLEAEMRDRLRRMREVRGHSSFWKQGPTEDMPHRILVVDECQTWFESRGFSKEKKALSEEIVALMTSLVKKGRSAGITVIMATQKPTADAIPSTLRDVCSLRIAFRVMNPESAKAILGDVQEGMSPVDLPAGTPGAAIFQTDSGEVVRARFAYTDEDLLRQLIEQRIQTDREACGV